MSLLKLIYAANTTVIQENVPVGRTVQLPNGIWIFPTFAGWTDQEFSLIEQEISPPSSGGGDNSVTIATQNQAVQGQENNVVMSPLRTREALAAAGFRLTGGFTSEGFDAGTMNWNDTFKPNPLISNYFTLTRNNQFTFMAPDEIGSYTIIVELTNGGNSFNTVTFSGFDLVNGSLTTTTGDKFQIFIAKTETTVSANIIAMQ